MNNTIFSIDWSPTSYAMINGIKLPYVSKGKGNPILFLLDPQTSLLNWNNIILTLSSLGQCILPCFISSDNHDDPEKNLSNQTQWLERLIESLNLTDITFVMHGWGGLIGLDYAMRHENRCNGLVFYETYLKPLNTEDLQLQQYIKQIPYITMDDPIDRLIKRCSNQLIHSHLPKLLFFSVPGFVTTMETVLWAKKHLSRLEIVDMGDAPYEEGEKQPSLMGGTMSIWLQGIEQEKIED